MRALLSIPNAGEAFAILHLNVGSGVTLSRWCMRHRAVDALGHPLDLFHAHIVRITLGVALESPTTRTDVLIIIALVEELDKVLHDLGQLIDVGLPKAS